MSAKFKQSFAKERLSIDVRQEHESRYWSRKFGVTSDELRLVVEKVGPMVQDVRTHFGKTTPPETRSKRRRTK